MAKSTEKGANVFGDSLQADTAGGVGESISSATGEIGTESVKISASKSTWDGPRTCITRACIEKPPLLVRRGQCS